MTTQKRILSGILLGCQIWFTTGLSEEVPLSDSPGMKGVQTNIASVTFGDWVESRFDGRRFESSVTVSNAVLLREIVDEINTSVRTNQLFIPPVGSLCELAIHAESGELVAFLSMSMADSMFVVFPAESAVGKVKMVGRGMAGRSERLAELLYCTLEELRPDVLVGKRAALTRVGWELETLLWGKDETNRPSCDQD